MKTYSQLMEEIKYTKVPATTRVIRDKPETHVFEHPRYRISILDQRHEGYLSVGIFHKKKNVSLGGSGYKDYGIDNVSWGSKVGGYEFKKHGIKEKEAREIFQHVSNHVKELGFGEMNPKLEYHTGDYNKLRGQ